MQASLSMTQLLSSTETAPEATSQGDTAPAAQPASLPQAHCPPVSISNSLDEVSFDCDGLDDMMWDELGDLGLDTGEDPDMYANCYVGLS